MTIKTFVASGAAVLLGASVFVQSASANGSLVNYQVTVTNVTNNISFTPILGVTHNRAVSLFEFGEPASDALEVLAEGGSPAALVDSLSDIHGVNTTVATAAGLPLPEMPFTTAGQSATFHITAPRWARHFSMAAMMLPTNDSFVALNSVRLPRRGTVTYTALGYDAGTEPNNELCVNIPGPQCDDTPDGNGAPDDLGGRTDRINVVHISAGIHGEGDLRPSAYDWRNPVAQVTITRMRR